LTEELYGAGCRKDSDLTSFINEVFYETYTSGKLQEIAATYGVEAALIEMPEATYEPAA
jgi:ABC-type amino acid transport substrate-binding protein